METIGGQAVIEGVMIRNKNKIATAVMAKDGIKVKEENFVSLLEKHRWLKTPIIRGTIALFETLKIGISSLNYSADILEEKEPKEKSSSAWFYLSLFISFPIAIFIFIFIPIFATTKLFNIEKTAVYFNLITGLMRIIIFLAYLYAISFIKDIKRMFMYHGAEHKVVNCYENGDEVSLKNARKYSTIHKRCGTSFLFVTIIIAIACFSLIDAAFLYYLGRTSVQIRLISHLLFLPFVLGTAYEIIKLASVKTNSVTSIITYPGTLLQKITTLEPDDSMINVAIAALKKIV